MISASDRIYDSTYLGWRLGYEEAWARDIHDGDVVTMDNDGTIVYLIAFDIGKGFILK